MVLLLRESEPAAGMQFAQFGRNLIRLSNVLLSESDNVTAAQSSEDQEGKR